MLLRTIGLLLLLFTALVPAQTEHYQDLLNKTISKHIPGVVLLVTNPNVEFLGAAGLADIESKTPMSVNTVTPNGSAGKKLTALLAAMLHQQGKLDLDAPVRRYLPGALLDKIPHSQQMTTRMLLNHTSGLYNYSDDYDFFATQFARPQSFISDQTALAHVYHKPGYFEPGEDFAYSNSGYNLVGLILDKVTGQHHHSSIRRDIFTPMALQHSYYNGYEQAQYQIASGYFTNDEDPEFVLPYGKTSNTRPTMLNTGLADAPLAANAQDIAKLLRSIVLAKGPVTQEVKQQMLSDKYLIPAQTRPYLIDSKLYYGLGIFVEKTPQQTIYHHGGTEFGYFTQNIYLPNTDTSITILANCGVNDSCEQPLLKLADELLRPFVTNQ